MRTFCLLLLGGLLVASAAEAAKVYRWVDAKGQVHYGDVPDDKAGDVQEVSTRTGAETQESKPPDPAVAEAERIAACTTRREQLATYENSVRLIEKDNLGREREFSPEDKALLIDRTRVEVVQLCGEGADLPGVDPEIPE